MSTRTRLSRQVLVPEHVQARRLVRRIARARATCSVNDMAAALAVAERLVQAMDLRQRITGGVPLLKSATPLLRTRQD